MLGLFHTSFASDSHPSPAIRTALRSNPRISILLHESPTLFSGLNEDELVDISFVALQSFHPKLQGDHGQKRQSGFAR
jgi:hypothetical protein